ncbi:hypothetical protein [Dongia sp.]|uniref:hypothetical protein n=1 Tax=Dongia sp. TaxID=1977262 RepID=UPI0035B086D3
MTRTILAILVAVSIIVISAIIPALAQEAQPALPSGNNCTEGEMIDASTAEQAKAKIEAAGYSDVVITTKGCDNFWHATAVKDGMPGNVVLSPDGMVLPEGN